MMTDLFDQIEPVTKKGVRKKSDYSAKDIEVLEGLEPVDFVQACMLVEQTNELCII